MSYCRWSSDFGQCDVYVYYSVGDFYSTGVARRRLRYEPPQSLRDMPHSSADEILAMWRAEDAWRDSFKGSDGEIADEHWLDLKTIGEEAGNSFEDTTASDCADRLEALRTKGFNVPQYAIDELREEARDAVGT